MGKAKIAPALEAVLGWPPPYSKIGITAAEVSIQAERELRALLAVARAADSLWRADPARGAHFERLRRAIVALARASGRKP